MIEDLAKNFWPQLKDIASAKGYRRVFRVEMIVGSLYGSADSLTQQFRGLFPGSAFAGAQMQITIVQPGQTYKQPEHDEELTANGWDILITRLEGEE